MSLEKEKILLSSALIGIINFISTPSFPPVDLCTQGQRFKRGKSFVAC